MPRWQPDKADWAADCWAEQWVSRYARDPRTARETLGPLRCTLGRVRIMGDGAASGTVVTQHFPEGFLGDGLVVHRLTHELTEQQRAWLWHHYVGRWYALRLKKWTHSEQVFEPVRLHRPVKQLVAAEELCIGLPRYYQIRERVKILITAALEHP